MPFRLHDKPQQPENSHEDELFADAKIVTPLLKNVAHDFLTFGERVLNYNSPKDKSWLRTQFSDKILKPSMYRQGPPKTRLRARQKAADKGWEHLSDLARGCIEVSNKNQLAVLISLFKCAKTNPDLCYLPHDAEVISIKDKYTTP